MDMKLLLKIRAIKVLIGEMLRLMVGVPDYETYLQHMQTHHPDSSPKTYEAFFNERQKARYQNKGSRCC
jgi:uncharacterized short protein YbdD (DUF466 family)